MSTAAWRKAWIFVKWFFTPTGSKKWEQRLNAWRIARGEEPLGPKDAEATRQWLQRRRDA